jgi:Papain family cysteine protease
VPVSTPLSAHQPDGGRFVFTVPGWQQSIREDIVAKSTPRGRKADRSKTPEKSRVPKRSIDGRRMDARADRIDFRDLRYQPPLRSLPERWPDQQDIGAFLPRYRAAGLILDQGNEGACTGFGLACVVNYLLWLREGTPKRFGRVSPAMLYRLARIYDEWDGEDYEGSSCRGALKGWQKHGVCGEAFWPYDAQSPNPMRDPLPDWDRDATRRRLGVYYRIDKNAIVDMQAAIHEIGAIYVSSDVHKGWTLDATKKAATFDNLPIIKRNNAPADGGHAFALTGYDSRGFIVQNSWGPDWGLGGFAILPYEDWLSLGADAWACALGVARSDDAVTPPRSIVTRSRRARLSALIGVDRVKAGTSAAPRITPADPYERTVVLGNNGVPVTRLVSAASAAANVEAVAYSIPQAWFESKPQAKDLVIYAHGGLNHEDSSIDRIRVLAPVFESNDIYPLFLTWKTGVKETLQGMIEDRLRDLPAKDDRATGAISDLIAGIASEAIEAVDRGIEVIARNLGVGSIWSQMKQNAESVARPGGGGHMLAAALGKLRADRGDNLRIHLVGHSAGAIILGHLLPLLHGQVASCTLFAPACTVEFANQHYGAPVAGKLDHRKLRIHVLSDELEQADSVGPYKKSLLYLVSRALEPLHKTPILGLANSFDPRFNGSANWNGDRQTVGDGQSSQGFVTAQLKQWQKFWAGIPGAADERSAWEATTRPTCPKRFTGASTIMPK